MSFIKQGLFTFPVSSQTSRFSIDSFQRDDTRVPADLFIFTYKSWPLIAFLFPRLYCLGITVLSRIS